MNKLVKEKIYTYLLAFQWESVYRENACEVAKVFANFVLSLALSMKAAKNPTYTEVYAFVCFELYQKCPSEEYRVSPMVDMSSGTLPKDYWRRLEASCCGEAIASRTLMTSMNTGHLSQVLGQFMDSFEVPLRTLPPP